jgi:hypothetical protein
MFLSALLSQLPKGETYAMVYTTNPQFKPLQLDTPTAQEVYEMDDPFPSSVHMDLKRDIEGHSDNTQVNSSLPLFERYQYFTPGEPSETFLKTNS